MRGRMRRRGILKLVVLGVLLNYMALLLLYPRILIKTGLRYWVYPVS